MAHKYGDVRDPKIIGENKMGVADIFRDRSVRAVAASGFAPVFPCRRGWRGWRGCCAKRGPRPSASTLIERPATSRVGWPPRREGERWRRQTQRAASRHRQRLWRATGPRGADRRPSRPPQPCRQRRYGRARRNEPRRVPLAVCGAELRANRSAPTPAAATPNGAAGCFVSEDTGLRPCSAG
jgi:hypothetical protein